MRLRQPEVEQLRTRFGQDDVAGFEVPVDDARAVRFIEGVGDLNRDCQRLSDRQCTIC
jgi:hypothetical protein